MIMVSVPLGGTLLILTLSGCFARLLRTLPALWVVFVGKYVVVFLVDTN